MRQRIALCDPDREYAERIVSFVRDSEFRKEAEITVCSEPELLPEWIMDRKFDVFAISLDYAEQIGHSIESGVRIVWLSGQERGNGPYGFPLALKYSAAPILIRMWLGDSGRKTDPGRPKAAPIAAVWSVCGGVGKTKFTSSIANVWRESGRSLFILGIDPGLFTRMAKGEVMFHDVSDWLYAMKSGRRPEGDVKHGTGLHFLLPDTSYREWVGLGRKESAMLLELAATACGCDAVLVDAGTGWSVFTEEVWNRADALLCLAAEEEHCLIKTDKWLGEWPEWQEGGLYREKTMFAVNKCLPNTPSHAADWFRPAAKFPYVPEWKQVNDRVDPLFQQQIMRLSEELWIHANVGRPRGRFQGDS